MATEKGLPINKPVCQTWRSVTSERLFLWTLLLTQYAKTNYKRELYVVIVASKGH